MRRISCSSARRPATARRSTFCSRGISLHCGDGRADGGIVELQPGFGDGGLVGGEAGLQRPRLRLRAVVLLAGDEVLGHQVGVALGLTRRVVGQHAVALEVGLHLGERRLEGARVDLNARQLAALIFRRGPTTGNRLIAAADPRISRTDRVRLEMSPYDVTRGRINYRHLDKAAGPPQVRRKFPYKKR